MSADFDISYDKVHLGAWIDQSKGSIAGANVTVTSTGGAVLVAFLALFIQYSGQQLWGILSFIWHQYRVSRRPKTALQYQQDASLRNHASPGQTFAGLTEIAWSWRHSRKQNATIGWWRTAVFPILLPLIYLILLIVAGILSSSIVETSDLNVLLREDGNCGIWRMPEDNDLVEFSSAVIAENIRYGRKAISSSRGYARACYNQTGAQQSPTCKAFAQPSVPSSNTNDTACPFDPITCTLPEGNLRMDTGEVDTNSILGINSNTDNVIFRKVTTCAPLKPDLYIEKFNISIIFPEHNQTQFYVNWLWGNLTGDIAHRGIIVQADSFSGNALGVYTTIIRSEWPMDSRLKSIDQSHMELRKEFQRPDGDVHIIFLQGNGILFSEPSDDPWFAAHTPKTLSNSTIDGYIFDHIASPMGCVDQYQYCNPHVKGRFCTPLAGIVPATAEAKATLDLSATQTSIVDIIFNAVYWTTINVASVLSDKPDILAEDNVQIGMQVALPNNQWATEMQHTNNVVLAMLQRVIIDYSRDKGDKGATGAKEFIVEPSTAESKALCSMMRVRSRGGFSNINQYGLGLVLGFGTLIILMNTFGINILVRFRRWRKTDSWRSDTWFADGLFQIQKAAFAAHPKQWQRIDSGIPVMESRKPVERTDTLVFGSGSALQDVEKKGEQVDVDSIKKGPVASVTWKSDGSNEAMRVENERPAVPSNKN